MTPQQVKLVQDSFKHVLPIKAEAAALFYTRLFEDNPELRKLFKDDMEEQGRKLMHVLATVVGSLHRLDQIVPAVKALGRKHVDYGVTDNHYPLVGTALLSTLRQGLGPRFTAEVEDAWATAYSLLAGVMQTAAREAAEPPARNAEGMRAG